MFADEKTGRKQTHVTLQQAWAFHRNCLIIDGHNDAPVMRLASNESGRRETTLQWMQRDDIYQTDLQRARENGQQYVVFMILAPGWGSKDQVLRNLAEIARQIGQHPDDIQQVLTSADAIAAGKSAKVGIISAIEGGSGPLEGDLENLRKFYDLGLRLAGISHGEGGPDAKFLQGEPSQSGRFPAEKRQKALKNTAGLTPFGFEVLKLSNKLGIITDLAHINDKAFLDVVENTALPPIASHTAAYSLCRMGRCMTDDQLKALAAVGGVAGMTFVPQFLDDDPPKVPDMVERFVDHLCYVADLVGVDHVAIGSDFDGGVPQPVVKDVSQLVLITRAMMARGFSEEEIRKIWHGNFLRIMRQTIDK